MIKRMDGFFAYLEKYCLPQKNKHFSSSTIQKFIKRLCILLCEILLSLSLPLPLLGREMYHRKKERKTLHHSSTCFKSWNQISRRWIENTKWTIFGTLCFICKKERWFSQRDYEYCWYFSFKHLWFVWIGSLIFLLFIHTFSSSFSLLVSI
jgi:hypothetical protein